MDPVLLKHIILQSIKNEENRKRIFTLIASIFVAIFFNFYSNSIYPIKSI